MRPRTQAREAALQALYQLDLRPELEAGDLDRLLEDQVEQPSALAFARELVRGTRLHLAAIDAEVAAVAENWEMRRMAAVDRNVLRLAAYELLHRDDIPAAVAIDEAVTLAKKFSTKESGSFVNGILDQVAKRHAVATSPLEPPAPGEAEA